MTNIALDEIRRRVRNIWGAISSNQVIDKDVEGQAKQLLEYVDDLRRSSPSQVAPANPAQVTDDDQAEKFRKAMLMAERVLGAIPASVSGKRLTAIDPVQVEISRAVSILWGARQDAIHAGWNPTVAIGAGGQAVAWRISCPDDEIYGRGPDTVRFHPLSPDEIASGYTQQPLSALSHPHPADERVVEALEPGTIRICPRRDGPCPHGLSCLYNVGMDCDIEASRADLAYQKQAVLSAKEGRKNG